MSVSELEPMTPEGSATRLALLDGCDREMEAGHEVPGARDTIRALADPNHGS